MQADSSAGFLEFFAGGGMARLGLQPYFQCTFANDIDPAKAAAYVAAFGDAEMRQGDIWGLSPACLPPAALAWASFPCQDLSLAGARRGLAAPRSGAFWGLHRLLDKLGRDAPPMLVLENVTGLLTSHGGADFIGLASALDGLGYRVGALEIDAALFTPQSRPRLFLVASRRVPSHLSAAGPSEPFHTRALRGLVARMPQPLRKRFVWWRLPAPPRRNADLIDVLEQQQPPDAWRSEAQTRALLALMSPLQRARIDSLRASGKPHVGAVFRRIRVENGVKVQRAEARFDGLAGCLRTPAGGSSRQMLLFVEGAQIRSRLLAPREAARLMGVPDEYPLPQTQTAALHLLGDGVCVSAVRWLAQELLAPLAGVAAMQARA
jgi:DNA (cytosine-5)-methyltransferase 1